MVFDRFDHASHTPLAPALVEPGPDQRWSTWPATTPSERGPRPYPSWLVTAAAALDTELGVVKSGKEADVFLIERAVPDSAGCVLAAKRYRDAAHSDFHRSGRYEEGRRVRNSRDARAIERKSSHGRAVAAGHWAASEFSALVRAWDAGIPVPYPVQLSGTELLMEFIGDGARGGPPARAVTPARRRARGPVRPGGRGPRRVRAGGFRARRPVGLQPARPSTDGSS